MENPRMMPKAPPIPGLITEPRVVGRNDDSWATWAEGVAEYHQYNLVAQATRLEVDRLVAAFARAEFEPREWQTALQAQNIAEANRSTLYHVLARNALGDWSDEGKAIESARNAATKDAPSP